MKIKFPMLVLSYSQTKLLSVEDDSGNVIIPIFTEAERAESYRRHIARTHNQKIDVLMIPRATNAIDLIESIRSTEPKFNAVCIDPPPPIHGHTTNKCVDPIAFVAKLLAQNPKARIRQSQKARSQSRRKIRTKKG
jgi:hypothetical protein